MTVTLPRGALSAGLVGPKSATTGVPRAAARWATPVSPDTSTAISVRTAGRRAGLSRPTRLTTGTWRNTSAAAGTSDGAPRSTGITPRAGARWQNSTTHSRAQTLAGP